LPVSVPPCPNPCHRLSTVSLKRKSARTALHLCSLTLMITLALAGAANTGLLRVLEWIVWDQGFALRSPEPVDDRIVIITIDESDITSLGRWPMADGVMADLLERIQQQQPRLVAVDIYRDLEVPPGHGELQEKWRQWDNVLGIEKVAGDPVPPPQILAEKAQVGANDLLVDQDGKIRRSLILVGRSDQSMITSLGAEAALRYLQQEGIELQEEDADRNIYRLGSGRYIPLTGQDGLYRESDMGGYQILLNYRGGLDRFLHVSLQSILQGNIPPDLMRDRLVFIGAIAPSLNDNHRTPYANFLFQESRLLPGVVIHANLSSQMIAAALDDRPMLRPLQRRLSQGWLLFWAGWSVAWGLEYAHKPWRTSWGLGLGVVILPLITYGGFQMGWLVPLVSPLLAVAFGGISGIISTLWVNLRRSYKTLAHQHQQLQTANQELQKLNETYRRFVPLEYVELLEHQSILDVSLGDHVNRSMAVAFSDIRSFTSLCEPLTPQEVFDFVNAYLQRVGPEIRNHSGVIVKFIGDAIMAVFPRSVDDAIWAGIAQYQRLREYNQARMAAGQVPIQIGMGIHVGRVMVGIIGEAGRMQGDVLSDAVNLAARLESLTKVYGTPLLVSGDTLQELTDLDQFTLRLIDEVVVKGRKEPIALFEILEAETAEMAALKSETRLWFEQGWFHYRGRNLSAARDCFQQVISCNPKDKAAQLYLRRMEVLEREGFPEGWQGVWQFQEK
jgi:adenylate cyclase